MVRFRVRIRRYYAAVQTPPPLVPPDVFRSVCQCVCLLMARCLSLPFIGTIQRFSGTISGLQLNVFGISCRIVLLTIVFD